MSLKEIKSQMGHGKTESPVAATPSSSPEIEQSLDSELEADEYSPALFAYLDSERGHQLAGRVLDLFEGIKKATLDERSKSKAIDSEVAKMTLRHTWMLKTLGLFLITSAIVGLSIANRLTPAAGTILGAIAGYILGQPGHSPTGRRGL